MKLVVEAEGGSTILDPQQPYFIGRDKSSEIQLTNSKISRKHARLDFLEGKWVLRDLDSANGTYSKGKKISRVEIREGLILYLGGETGVQICFSFLKFSGESFVGADKTQYFDFSSHGVKEPENDQLSIRLGNW